jgi:uncharacterized surface protein with fasciclin (FAS1) repeats
LATEPHTLLVPTNEAFSKNVHKTVCGIDQSKEQDGTDQIYECECFLSNKYNGYRKFKLADIIDAG